jgi:hypothetical protein
MSITVNRFVFNSEAIKLKQVICDIHILVNILINNRGQKLNGELKSMEEIADKTNKIKKELELSNDNLR